jgi:hypothetical protein
MNDDDKIYEILGLDPVSDIRVGLRRGRSSGTMLAALWSGALKIDDVYLGTKYKDTFSNDGS